MGNYVSKLLEVAEAQVGYLEKKSNSNLDSKTANAGYNNYTKFARDLDKLGYFYNGPKNGYAWCDVFVDWCFVTAFGVEEAMKLLQQPKKSYGAGCGYSANYYKKKGQFHTKNPKPGDQIFFWNSSKNDVAHTGIVYDVDATYVYTIEGNTSSTSGVIANGGGVFKKKYKLTYTRLYGYGRPNYDVEPATSTPVESPKEEIPVVTPSNAVHKVVKGDTLWNLAEEWLGNGSRYKEIMTLNNLKSATLRIGQILQIPADEKAEETVVIKKGDTVRLKSGAKTYDGKALWSSVYKRNHKVKELSSNRAVITYAGVVVAAVHVKDLVIVK